MQKLFFIATLCLAFATAANGAAKERIGDPYTLKTCAVSGEALGSMGEAPIFIHEDGREVRFCCGGCEKKYKANAEAMNEKIDKKLIADQEKHYPNNKCINSGSELKDGGNAFIVGNRLLKTCCAKCEAKVKADPATYIAKLDKEVIKARKDSYKAKACPVSGKDLGDTPVDMVVANRLIKVCCDGCKKKVNQDPRKAIDLVDAAK
jgi:hypothetical protein